MSSVPGVLIRRADSKKKLPKRETIVEKRHSQKCKETSLLLEHEEEGREGREKKYRRWRDSESRRNSFTAAGNKRETERETRQDKPGEGRGGKREEEHFMFLHSGLHFIPTADLVRERDKSCHGGLSQEGTVASDRVV